jgi:hypothetical protein
LFYLCGRLRNPEVLMYDLSCLAEVHKKWAASSWGRKLAVQQKRASLGDFDRFKVMVARVKVRVQEGSDAAWNNLEFYAFHVSFSVGVGEVVHGTRFPHGLNKNGCYFRVCSSASCRDVLAVMV